MSIYLDPEIRNWVFIPLLVGLLILAKVKLNIQRLIAGSAKKEVSVTSEQALAVRRGAIKLSRARHFIANCGLLPPASFAQRVQLYCAPEKGLLVHVEAEAENPLSAMVANPMMSPENMAGMLKGNLMLMATMGLQYWGVSHFFSGMLVGRVSFPVPQQFRQTLQKGVEVANIDVKYISALSLYFLTFFGIDKLLGLLLPRQEGEAEGEAPSASAMAMPAMPAPGADGQKKDFDAVMDEVKTTRHVFALDGALKDFVAAHRHLVAPDAPNRH